MWLLARTANVVVVVVVVVTCLACGFRLQSIRMLGRVVREVGLVVLILFVAFFCLQNG